ncbi:MAG: hypothetical protein PHD19_08860 [Dechloromonas sp.]|nr:hypothetical protein [Dechloromonas sp.]
MSSAQKKRGRPKGATTRAATPGRVRAKEFFHLIESDVRATRAAELIAEKWGVETCQIFKDRRRHEKPLTDEVRQEANETERHRDALRAAVEMGPHLPKNPFVLVFWAAARALRPIEKDESEC